MSSRPAARAGGGGGERGRVGVAHRGGRGGEERGRPDVTAPRTCRGEALGGALGRAGAAACRGETRGAALGGAGAARGGGRGVAVADDGAARGCGACRCRGEEDGGSGVAVLCRCCLSRSRCFRAAVSRADEACTTTCGSERAARRASSSPDARARCNAPSAAVWSVAGPGGSVAEQGGALDAGALHARGLGTAEAGRAARSLGALCDGASALGSGCVRKPRREARTCSVVLGVGGAV